MFTDEWLRTENTLYGRHLKAERDQEIAELRIALLETTLGECLFYKRGACLLWRKRDVYRQIVQNI